MASAETARLIASLELQDKFTPGIAKADASLAGFERRTTGSFNKLGTGLNRAGGNLKSFVASGAGLVGLSLGLAGIVKIGSDAITTASNFGENVEKVHKITGLATATASAMVDTLDKWGVSSDRLIPLLGRMEKNLGALAPNAKKAAAFQKEFNFSLLNGKGQIADANTLLLRAADYWNSNATATNKATVMSKLFGKAWQDMIPILSKGSKFIKDQEKDAIHLTDSQLKNIARFRNAQRDFADAWGDAQVIIGAELMPALTDLMKTFGGWLDKHQGDIAKFFKDGVSFARELGAAVQSTVVPAIDAIAKAWASVPPEFRQLLLGGLVANKVLKMTIGFDPIDIGRKVITDALGGIFSRGSPANPMFTKEVGLPGAPTVPGAPPGTPPGITIPAIGAAIAIDRNAITGPGSPVDDLLNEVKSWHKESTTVGFQGFEARGPGFRPGPLSPGSVGFTGFEGRGPGSRVGIDILRVLDAIHRDFKSNFNMLQRATDPAEQAKFASKTAQDIVAGVGSVDTTKQVIAVLKQQLAATKDPALRRVLQAALARVEKKLPGREWIAEQKAAANKIAKSNESVGQKVKDLRAIQERLIAHGDTAAARIVGALINSVVPAINNIRVIAGTTLPGVLPPRNIHNNNPPPTNSGNGNPDRNQNRGNPINNVRMNVTTSWKDTANASVTHSRFGPTPAEAGA